MSIQLPANNVITMWQCTSMTLKVDDCVQTHVRKVFLKLSAPQPLPISNKSYENEISTYQVWLFVCYMCVF